MKHFLLKTWLILVCLLTGVGTMWAETKTLTLDKLGSSLGSTSNEKTSTVVITATGTSDTYTLNYLQGKKQGDAILLAKSTGAFIANSTAMPGDIKSVTVYINNGASGKATYHCAFTSTACTEAVTTGSTAVNITGGNSNKYTCSTSGNKYFCVSLGNANNGQVLKLEVEYEVSGGSTPETPTALSVPTNLSSSNVTTTGASLSWDAVSNASSYTVKIGETEYTGINTNSYSATGLTAGTQYTWTVKAVGDGVSYSTSDYAANANFTTDTEQGGGEEPSGEGLYIDFESATSAYSDWIFTNIATQQTNSNVSAHGGSYFGTTDGKTTGSVQTTKKVNPATITFYISKTSTNTTSSNWKVQTSSNGTSWDDVKAFSASSVTRGEWTEVTHSLTAYKDVYVRIYYDGSTAVRCIDDVALTLVDEDAPVTETCQAPQFSVASGTYTSSQSVTLTCGTEGASIYYTLDGTNPSASSALYADALNITETTTVKAIAVKDGCENSEIAEANYTIIICDGDGTKENPYTLSDVTKLYTLKSKAWVVGYIRGCYSKTDELAAGEAVETNIAMSETVDGSTYYPVGLKAGDARTALNLKNHPENVGHEVKVYGQLDTYFSTAGVKDVTDFEWVSEAPSAKELVRITVLGIPTEFWKGDTFNHDGMTVTATYTDDSNEDVTSTAVFSGYDMATAGNQTVTVTYGGKTGTYEINVQTIANTQETAYTATQAKALIDAGNDLATEVYVAGTVSQIVTEYSSSYGNISFNVSADGATEGDQFQFFRNFKGADKQKWTSATEAPEVGDEVIGYGKLTKYNSTYEFAEGNYIVSLVKSTPSKTKPELSFADLSCEATLGQTFTAPALTNPEGVKVTYSSSAEGVATVDNTGAVTLVSAGNTTITASFDGTDSDTYESNSASYTLVVKEATTPEPGDVTPGTYDIAINNALWGTEENGAFNGTIPETLTGTQNGVTITFNKGKGANLYISDAETRIYANEELVVSVPEGYSITSIVNTSSSSKSATITTTPAGYDSETKTWTGNAQFVTFTVSGANGFQTLTVTFVQGGVTPEPTPDFGTINFVAYNNDGYWATFSSTKDVIFDANDVVVYTVAVDDNAVVMIEANNNSLSCVTDKTKDDGWVTGYYVQAGAGVLIYSDDENANYYFTDNDPYTPNILNEIGTDPEYNMLRAASVEMTGDYKFYKLAYNNYTNKTGLGFYWGKDGGAPFAAKEGGAYLAVPYATASNMRGFSFDSEDTLTAIEGISNNGVACEIYNLQGQRIQRLQQGVNIVNGRKVIR